MTSIDRKCLLGETPLMQTSFTRNIFCIGETLQLKGKKLCLFNLGQKKFLTFSLFLLILFFPFLSILSLWLNLKIKFPPFVSWFGSLLDSDQLVSSVFGANKRSWTFFFFSFFPIFLRPGVPGERKSGKVGLPSKDLVGRNFCWVMICSLAAFISFSPWNWTSTSLLEPQI